VSTKRKGAASSYRVNGENPEPRRDRAPAKPPELPGSPGPTPFRTALLVRSAVPVLIRPPRVASVPSRPEAFRRAAGASSASRAQGAAVGSRRTMSSFTAELIWRVSSKSNGKECVEVGQRQAAVLVRDTKNRDCGLLTFPSTAWKDFIKTIQTDGTITR
jgi:hypothetical protein